MIRLALIGCRYATRYAAATRRLQRAAFVAAVDADAGAARTAAQALDASVLARSLDELLADRSDAFDAVVIDSRNGSRGPLVEKAAAAGKHMLVEMPLALSTDAADAAIRVCRAAGVRLMVGQATRFMESHRMVKESLASGKLGAPGLLRIHRWEPLGPDAWRLSRVGADRNGGTLMREVVREIDLANWLFEGLPTEVYAIGRSPGGHQPDAHGYVQVHMGFPEGGMAMIDYSKTLPQGPGYSSLSVIGSTGGAYADDHHNTQLLYRGGETVALNTGHGEGHILAQLQEFASAVEEEREPAVTGEDGRAALQVAEAATASVESGRAARLDGGLYELV